MRQPSERDIEVAKGYLRRRLDAERSMSRNLETAMRQAAERIVEILYSANLPPSAIVFENLPFSVRMRIEEVIGWFKDTIDDYFITLATAANEENRDIIVPYILGEDHGSTFGERLDDYAGKFRNELLLLVGAGLILGIGGTLLSRSIGENLRHPYDNSLLADGIGTPLSYGRGRSNSMFNAIDNLTRFGIARGWMKSQYADNLKKGCVGWLVRRGSSFPCEICDSYVGFHTDESELPPFHNHCCCFAVPVYL